MQSPYERAKQSFDNGYYVDALLGSSLLCGGFIALELCDTDEYRKAHILLLSSIEKVNEHINSSKVSSTDIEICE